MNRPEEIGMDEILKHADWLRRLVRDLVPDPHRADDVLQDTWVRALLRPPVRRGSLRAWLARVAKSRLRDRLRRDGRARAREIQAARDPAASPSAPEAVAAVAAAELARRVSRALLALPEPYRGTLLLRYGEGVGAAEIARRQGIPDATVRGRVHRGLILLRGRLGVGNEGRGRRGIPAAVLLMSTKTKLAVGVAALLLICAGSGWLLLSGERDFRPPASPPAPAPVLAAAADGTAAAGAPRIDDHGRARGAGPAPGAPRGAGPRPADDDVASFAVYLGLRDTLDPGTVEAVPTTKVQQQLLESYRRTLAALEARGMNVGDGVPSKRWADMVERYRFVKVDRLLARITALTGLSIDVPEEVRRAFPETLQLTAGTPVECFDVLCTLARSANSPLVLGPTGARFHPAPDRPEGDLRFFAGTLGWAFDRKLVDELVEGCRGTLTAEFRIRESFGSPVALAKRRFSIPARTRIETFEELYWALVRAAGGELPLALPKAWFARPCHVTVRSGTVPEIVNSGLGPDAGVRMAATRGGFELLSPERAKGAAAELADVERVREELSRCRLAGLPESASLAWLGDAIRSASGRPVFVDREYERYSVELPESATVADLLDSLKDPLPYVGWTVVGDGIVLLREVPLPTDR